MWAFDWYVLICSFFFLETKKIAGRQLVDMILSYAVISSLIITTTTAYLKVFLRHYISWSSKTTNKSKRLEAGPIKEGKDEILLRRSFLSILVVDTICL
jgi:hypothetical protein